MRTCLARTLAVALVATLAALAVGATPLEGLVSTAADRGVLAMERPLDLADATPRAVRVRFEVSSAEEPGRLDALWSVARRAWLEPLPEQSLVRIHVPSVEVEAQLRSTGTQPIDGSFSDFVWLIDPETGEVLEATLTGRVRESIRLGPIHTSALVRIDVEMSTARVAGFTPGRGLLGLRTNRVCQPDPRAEDDSDCVGVPAVPFDPTRGYLNAVGRVRAASTFATIEAFSPLGEIQLTESAPVGTDVIVTAPTLPGAIRSANAASDGPSVGPSQVEALCSQSIGAACPADLGGES